jgi:hypothetical protein
MGFIKIMQNILDLSKFENVLCDSLQALEWARSKGLPENAIIRTSAPALLWGNDPYIHHLEAEWGLDRFKLFHNEISEISEIIYDIVKSEKCDDLALLLAQEVVIFSRIVFKAACLKKEDFNHPILFLKVYGDGGRGLGNSGNRMNPPWDDILLDNSLFHSIQYKLENDEWETQDPALIPFRSRLYIGGIETLLYRIATRIGPTVLRRLFNKRVLIHSENELIIETAANLIKKRVSIESMIIGDVDVDDDLEQSNNIKPSLHSKLSHAVDEWLSRWMVEDAALACQKLFFKRVNFAIGKFKLTKMEYKKTIKGCNKMVVLTNSPGGLKGIALHQVCRDKGIPVVSMQHGVTNEITSVSNEWMPFVDINASDYNLIFNYSLASFMKLSKFSQGATYVVGMPNRYARMNVSKYHNHNMPEIAYISTNLYKGTFGFFAGWMTDFRRAQIESNIVTKILSRLPHSIMYKAYPEETRRYPDLDPVLNYVKQSNNIELFQDKIDMRYLVKNHRLFVVSKASSTISWLVMSGKPVVFINWKNNAPLTPDAYKAFSKGMFLFDGDDNDFYEKLRIFLSKPILEIELLWDQKKEHRRNMVKEFFSAYHSGAGKRAAKFILGKCL